MILATIGKPSTSKCVPWGGFLIFRLVVQELLNWVIFFIENWIQILNQFYRGIGFYSSKEYMLCKKYILNVLKCTSHNIYIKWKPLLTIFPLLDLSTKLQFLLSIIKRRVIEGRLGVQETLMSLIPAETRPRYHLT